MKKISRNHDFCNLKMPDADNNILQSKPGKKSLKNAFVIYADLECLLLKTNKCNNNPNKSNTTAKALHKPSGYSLLTSCSFDKSENKQTYRGRDYMKRFCADLKEHVTRITIYEMKPMDPLTEDEKESYENQKLCHICEKEFCTDNNEEIRKVRDHCHYTGKYRGAAHSKCNLNYKVVKEIPVFSHNGSVYDYHLIIKYLTRKSEGNFECLDENTEKYISFTVPFKKVFNDKEIKYRIRISDSCRFMHVSLSNLVDNLSELKIKEIDNDVLIKRCYNTYQLSNNDINKFKLLLRKGVYPYEYMDSWKRFNETKLPSKDKFYSTLNLEDISADDYVHAINVWNTFDIENLGEYHDLYVKLDTSLLADVFENFRNKSIEIDKLDPAYFLTTTGLSWWACLKKTGLNLELLTDQNMFLIYEKGIRGGICDKVHSYAEANKNNKYMKNCNKNKESSFLMYVDANNLYGGATSKKLPVDEFKWVDDLSMFTEDVIKSYNEEDGVGYLLIVDIEYPKTLRMLHSDLPFLPEKIKINKCSNLICNVTDKKKYSIHIVALKQALNHGLILKKVHIVISYRQEAWLKPYIDLNTEVRKNVKNEFEKDFYKLKINSIYGKTVQNDRKHRDIKLVTTEYKRNKLASEPNYHSTKCISKDVLVMEMKKTEVKINKPIYLGQAILDLSKTLRYEFWYDYLKPMYGDKIILCYTDTDSFIMHIKTDEFYKGISADVDKWFDTSNFNKNDNRSLEIGKNKKVLGKFKDELGGKIMTNFLVLRAKTYSFLIDDFTDDDYEKNRIVNKKAKGTKKCVVKREILFNNYIG